MAGALRVVRGVLISAALALAACRPAAGPEVVMGPAVPAPPELATPASDLVQTPGIALDADHTVGPPIVVGALAVFPVYARTMEDIGEFLPLDAAIEKGVAVLHETGPEDGDEGHRSEGRSRGDGARVNTLVVENRGDLPILVLAGTVVKGGKQDRQIGQDFVIGKRQTVPVDAFCVEHGRWSTSRDGVATGGAFQSMKTLAIGGVRQAGQYEQNQGKVWEKVSQANKAANKETASDTLTALLDAPEVQAERERAGKDVQAFLASVPMADHTVGLAYAVGGEVQGARWFIHHRLFAHYVETLVNTAVADAFSQRAAAKAGGEGEAPGACAPEKVAAFVDGASRGRQEKRQTSGDNDNAYRFSDDALTSEVMMKAAPAAAGKPMSKPVTKDFLKKQ